MPFTFYLTVPSRLGALKSPNILEKKKNKKTHRFNKGNQL